MAYVVDLHIHSRYSRACSPQLNVPNLAQWAKLKGINVLGTGDFLHPLWLAELKKDLTEDGSGFLHPKDDQPLAETDTKFVLTCEIASIYTDKGQGRRVHNLVILPDFASVETFQKSLLSRRANLGSDGRPIVGISSKDLLSLALQVSDKALFVPSHIWTPWFGVFGSQSGYDSLKDCFEDLTQYVYGIETGLSSDPAMNWRVNELDEKSILSFSDAHSLPNLGREATVFEGELSYHGLWRAIKNPTVIPANAGIQLNKSGSELGPRLRGDDKVIGTLEFYPEEGKYHYTGHRNCSVKYTPEETQAKGTSCPVCKRGLTVGVMERVEEIASRENQALRIKNQAGVITTEQYPNRAGYRMLVPLMHILAEAFHTAPTTQKVITEYKKLVTSLGGEIKVLTKVPLEEIAKIAGPKIAEGVDKVRIGDLVIDPGYDGVYGVVKIWKEGADPVKEEQAEAPQLGLFD